MRRSMYSSSLSPVENFKAFFLFKNNTTKKSCDIHVGSLLFIV